MNIEVRKEVVSLLRTVLHRVNEDVQHYITTGERINKFDPETGLCTLVRRTARVVISELTLQPPTSVRHELLDEIGTYMEIVNGQWHSLNPRPGIIRHAEGSVYPIAGRDEYDMIVKNLNQRDSLIEWGEPVPEGLLVSFWDNPQTRGRRLSLLAFHMKELEKL